MTKSIYWPNISPLKGLLLMGLLFCASCQDDDAFVQDETTKTSDLVSFSMPTPKGWNTTEGVRSAKDDSIAHHIGGPVEMGTTPDGKRLLLSVAVTDGIEEEMSKDTTTIDGKSRASQPLPEDDALDLAVFSYWMRGEEKPEAYDGTTATPFMRDNFVDVSENYAYTPVKYWPGISYWLKFFAYRPYIDNVNIDGETYLTVSDEGNVPTLEYTVPDDVNKQVDLLSASTDLLSGDYKQKVQLNFQHLLSAVKFKVGDIPALRINEIGLKGIKNKGIHTMGQNGMNVSDETETKNFEQFFEEKLDVSTLQANGGQIGKTFFMIPQAFDDNAQLGMTIEFEKGGKLSWYELTHPLKELTPQWDSNKTYTYSLNTPEEISVEVTDETNGNVKENLHMKNTGLATVYIRATMVGDWVIENESGSLEIIDSWDADIDGVFDWGTNERKENEMVHWRKGSDGFYYYMTPIERDKEVNVPLFKSYTLTANPPVPNAFLELTIAIQATLVTDVTKVWPQEIYDMLR